MPKSLTRFTFNKEERLSSRKLIEKTVAEGKTIFVHPFTLTWLAGTAIGSFPAQVAIVVSKRKFQRAVDRNRIKRQIRESYRKQKHELYSVLENKNMRCTLMIVFIGKTMIPSDEIEKKLKLILQRFEEDIIAHPG